MNTESLFQDMPVPSRNRRQKTAQDRKRDRVARRDEIRAEKRAWYYRNREAVLAHRREDREANPEKHRKWNRAGMERFIAKHPGRREEITKRAALKYLYGMSLDDVNALFDAQQSCCLICGTTMTRDGGRKATMRGMVERVVGAFTVVP